jgi:two-component system chemotaxis response regulator CheY
MLKSTANYDFEGLSVLLIDGNRHMRVLVRSILQTLGCRNIQESGDSAEALRENLYSSIDLIIVSWMLEPITGLEFVKRVRASEDSPNKFVPIIMMSGQCQYNDVIVARDAGVNEFLAKPISPNTLYQRILSIITKPREFITHDSYCGPCRRRQLLGPPPGVGERRKSDPFSI